MAKDYTSLVKTAKGLLDKFGTAMQVIQNTHGTYNGTNDSYSSTATTFDTIGVKVNPRMVTPEGVWGKSDRIRLLLNGSALPTLDQIDFHVIIGSAILKPETVAVVAPGITPILYMVDMK